MKRYVVRGVIAPHGANYALVGQYTYLTMTAGWPTWDGEHRAHKFPTVLAALAAAGQAKGPLFRMPSEETIEVIDVDED